MRNRITARETRVFIPENRIAIDDILNAEIAGAEKHADESQLLLSASGVRHGIKSPSRDERHEVPHHCGIAEQVLEVVLPGFVVAQPITGVIRHSMHEVTDGAGIDAAEEFTLRMRDQVFRRPTDGRTAGGMMIIHQTDDFPERLEIDDAVE